MKANGDVRRALEELLEKHNYTLTVFRAEQSWSKRSGNFPDDEAELLTLVAHKDSQQEQEKKE